MFTQRWGVEDLAIFVDVLRALVTTLRLTLEFSTSWVLLPFPFSDEGCCSRITLAVIYVVSWCKAASPNLTNSFTGETERSGGDGSRLGERLATDSPAQNMSMMSSSAVVFGSRTVCRGGDRDATRKGDMVVSTPFIP